MSLTDQRKSSFAFAASGPYDHSFEVDSFMQTIRLARPDDSQMEQWHSNLQGLVGFNGQYLHSDLLE
jgi:hypothetical protein